MKFTFRTIKSNSLPSIPTSLERRLPLIQFSSDEISSSNNSESNLSIDNLIYIRLDLSHSDDINISTGTKLIETLNLIFEY